MVHSLTFCVLQATTPPTYSLPVTVPALVQSFTVQLLRPTTPPVSIEDEPLLVTEPSAVLEQPSTALPLSAPPAMPPVSWIPYIAPLLEQFSARLIWSHPATPPVSIMPRTVPLFTQFVNTLPLPASPTMPPIKSPPPVLSGPTQVTVPLLTQSASRYPLAQPTTPP